MQTSIIPASSATGPGPGAFLGAAGGPAAGAGGLSLHSTTLGGEPEWQDPATNCLTWVNPTLGTILNGARATELITIGMAALRGAFSAVGFRVADEQLVAARLLAGRTDMAERMVLSDVDESIGCEAPAFRIGIRLLSTLVPGSDCPTYTARPLAQSMDGKVFLMGERAFREMNWDAWADQFCAELTAKITP